MKYDTEEIKKRFEEMTAYDQGWDRWFAAEQINPFRLSYESLSENPQDTLRLILERLGLNSEIAAGVEVGVAKLADETSYEWVARFSSE